MGRSQGHLTSASGLKYVPVLVFARLGAFERKGAVCADLLTEGSVLKWGISLRL